MPALFVDQLTVIDFAFFDTHRGIVGESWIVDLVLEGELDDQGMVFDFGDVKKRIKQAIDATVDHKFVVPAKSEHVSSTTNEKGIELRLTDTSDNRYYHQSPEQAVVMLDADKVTMKAVSKVLNQACLNVVPENVVKIHLHLSTESIEGDYYHYAHGLKKHLGDCQRIAHGHRSQIHVFKNGQRNRELEALWCEKWEDIYIGTEEDMVGTEHEDPNDYYRFAYTSEQGHFSLELPQHRCHIMKSDSTVELIANHIAKQLKSIEPNASIRVKAFEGVNKGAIANA
ncbi:6-pyruvoyl trahydropterin synthase family protein [Kangiella sediminilitoris]|uniref:6-carboxy-5,6,7,8-tetrahydropterin synthase n=1 Tax=Kangiella sediminilitoris TaxID=1144748 RepID=A0A1B3B9R8_9GAMM|nr:6-carboxytetrahydropterin synthase [Kangiella sediminilitoris]AOE49542.1 6-pyruvoyl tetrahydropterin reductase [Kangiella sediminilitoris]